MKPFIFLFGMSIPFFVGLNCNATPPPVSPSVCTSKFCVAHTASFDNKRSGQFEFSTLENAQKVMSKTLYKDGSSVKVEMVNTIFSKDAAENLSQSHIVETHYGEFLEKRQTLKYCGFQDEFEGMYCSDIIVTYQGKAKNLRENVCLVYAIWVSSPYAPIGDLSKSVRFRFDPKPGAKCEALVG